MMPRQVVTGLPLSRSIEGIQNLSPNVDFMVALRVAARTDISGKIVEGLHAHRLKTGLFGSEIGVAFGMTRIVAGVGAKHVARKQILRVANRAAAQNPLPLAGC